MVLSAFEMIRPSASEKQQCMSSPPSSSNVTQADPDNEMDKLEKKKHRVSMQVCPV